MTTQTVTIFTPADISGEPINGGYPVQSYSKKVLNNVRYRFSEGVSTSISGGAVTDSLFVTVYDTAGYGSEWIVKKGDTLIVLGEYAGDTPPTDNSYFRANLVDVRYDHDGSIHNIRVSAR